MCFKKNFTNKFDLCSTNGVNLIKLFGVNLLTIFCKLDHFINISQLCCMAMK